MIKNICSFARLYAWLLSIQTQVLLVSWWEVNQLSHFPSLTVFNSWVTVPSFWGEHKLLSIFFSLFYFLDKHPKVVCTIASYTLLSKWLANWKAPSRAGERNWESDFSTFQWTIGQEAQRLNCAKGNVQSGIRGWGRKDNQKILEGQEGLCWQGYDRLSFNCQSRR